MRSPYPYVRGISRMFDNKRAVLISLDYEPSDNELRVIHDTLNQARSALTSWWQPIETLHRIDTDIVLWNPCDGVHLLPVTIAAHELDSLRRGGMFTHWRKLDHPEPRP